MPPLSEQNRIVQKLDELMLYCNALEAIIKQSESQNEKLLQQVLREALRPVPLTVGEEPKEYKIPEPVLSMAAEDGMEWGRATVK